MNTIPKELTFDDIDRLIKDLKNSTNKLDLHRHVNVNMISHYAVRIIDNLAIPAGDKQRIHSNTNGEVNLTKTPKEFVKLYRYFENILIAQYEYNLDDFIKNAEDFMSKLEKVEGYKNYTVRYNDPNNQNLLRLSRPGTPVRPSRPALGGYKKTEERVVLKGGAKRVVYTGKRGGKYIKVDGKFKALYKHTNV
jgi:hypothetical protein